MLNTLSHSQKLFSPINNEYLDFIKMLDYSINLIWINAKKKEDQEYLFENHRITYICNQLQKWCLANSATMINMWYDSRTTTAHAIDKTKQLFKSLSDQILLKDVRDIPFVQANADVFEAILPPYFWLDCLKLFIPLFEMENMGRTAVIQTDFSIGDKVEKVLGKRELFSKDIFYRLKKLGMLVGHDSVKPENQFLQFYNEPNLIEALKHTINSTLLIVSNTLNLAIKDKNLNLINCIQETIFVATMARIYIYLQILQANERPLIRADIVKEGTAMEWVPYDAIKHQYCLFGNFQLAFHSSAYLPEIKVDSQFILIQNFVKLPKAVNLPIYAKGSDFWDDSLFNEAVRTDLNPGYVGINHNIHEVQEWPRPKNGETFVPSYYPLTDNNFVPLTPISKPSI